ncbi:hypothetical protein [Streptomyces sp. NBC_00009]|uniref:MmyB family transcriptional regulator n=1 Tax=Streptomyces sp. NBC_00009 TaxID=2975620 RepID=UPI0032533DE2
MLSKTRNVLRYLFLHPDAPKLFDDWEEQARACIERLRVLAGTDPDLPELVELVAELLHKSRAFARLWEQYDVRLHTHGDKTFHHPQVGDIVLGYQPISYLAWVSPASAGAGNASAGCCDGSCVHGCSVCGGVVSGLGYVADKSRRGWAG